MNLKPLLIALLLPLACSQKINSQDWNEFANTSRYDKANHELKLHTTANNRVVFMGNSITEDWLKIRTEFFDNRDYINRGISGQTTPQMLLRFRQDVVDLNPKVVVILAGTNDIAGNSGYISLEAIISTIISMAEIANANDIQVIISSILPAIDYPWKPGLDPASKIIIINKALKAFSEENNFIYLDYYAVMVDDKGGLKVPEYTTANDLVHPNKKGYLVMEKLAKIAIKKALAK